MTNQKRFSQHPDRNNLFFPFQMDGHVNRDPSRLIRPTKGWEERMKHVGPSGQGPMLQMFHRYGPLNLISVLVNNI